MGLWQRRDMLRSALKQDPSGDKQRPGFGILQLSGQAGKQASLPCVQLTVCLPFLGLYLPPLVLLFPQLQSFCAPKSPGETAVMWQSYHPHDPGLGSGDACSRPLTLPQSNLPGDLRPVTEHLSLCVSFISYQEGNNNLAQESSENQMRWWK